MIGKPNAGKSSIINKILGEDRMIVSDVPGTTRDAVDSIVSNSWGEYLFVDTAGIRRNARIDDRIEHFSVLRAKAAAERADVCVLMVDSTEGVTAQDERVAGIAHEAGKPTVIVMNKWEKTKTSSCLWKALRSTWNRYAANNSSSFTVTALSRARGFTPI